MAIKYEEYNHVCVLTLDSDLHAGECEGVRKHVEQLIEKKQIVDFVVDFEKAGFIDSAGLETLLWLKRKAEDAPNRDALAGAIQSVSGHVVRLAYELRPDEGDAPRPAPELSDEELVKRFLEEFDAEELSEEA